MKKFIKKYKEILISLIIIAIFIALIIINFKISYLKVYNINIEEPKIQDTQNQGNTQNNENLEIEDAYYIKDGKLYNNKMGENEIKNFGDYSKMEDGPIQYLEFVNQNTGYMYRIEDVAMTVAWGTISKTSDGGITWEKVSHGIDEIFKLDSKVKFFNEETGFITMPQNGGNSCDLYITNDGGITFNKIQVEHIELNDTDLKWEQIYDYYNMPTKSPYTYNLYNLEISQGADGDYNGGDKKTYMSYDGGITWTSDELVEEKNKNWEETFDERVKNRSDKIFLKDFTNYNPGSSEIKITQTQAEQIAEIGFEEAATIGEAGDKEAQQVRIDEAYANNFFTMDHNAISHVYNNIKRKCYIISRENELGNGSLVYVDVTTGLIIGGGCFGD